MPRDLLPRRAWESRLAEVYFVVCGRAEVMASFCPNIWLRSVDFPTLGRPMRVTNPHRCPASFGSWDWSLTCSLQKSADMYQAGPSGASEAATATGIAQNNGCVQCPLFPVRGSCLLAPTPQ